jgi:hypothetical protein
MALLGAASNEANQKSSDTFKENGLSDDQQNRNRGIDIPVLNFELVQPLSQQMEHEKKVSNDENRVDYELNRKSSHCSGDFTFHEARSLKASRRCLAMLLNQSIAVQW